MLELPTADAAEMRRLQMVIAAALRDGRTLTDPEVIEVSRRMDRLALRAMRRESSGSGQPDPGN
ncbi:MAG TPA: aspartyl-phosphate phosphatase Spo0E family protein [Bacillota bacterium]|nr:aspartyl-phosphate phosphatase Spo0E family protein [Bacillota bacterium]